jgi:hypothetical protein
MNFLPQILADFISSIMMSREMTFALITNYLLMGNCLFYGLQKTNGKRKWRDNELKLKDAC